MRRYCQPSIGKGKNATKYLRVVVTTTSNPVRIFFGYFDLTGFTYTDAILTVEGLRQFLIANSFTTSNRFTSVEAYMKSGIQPYEKLDSLEMYATSANAYFSANAGTSTYTANSSNSNVQLSITTKIVEPI